MELIHILERHGAECWQDVAVDVIQVASLGCRTPLTFTHRDESLSREPLERHAAVFARLGSSGRSNYLPELVFGFILPQLRFFSKRHADVTPGFFPAFVTDVKVIVPVP